MNIITAKCIANAAKLAFLQPVANNTQGAILSSKMIA